MKSKWYYGGLANKFILYIGVDSLRNSIDQKVESDAKNELRE